MKRLGIVGLALAATLLTGCEDDTVVVELDPSFAVSRSEVTTAAALGTGPVTELVKIINGTDGTLRGLAAEIQILSGSGQWLGATLDQTTATRDQAATLRLQANPDVLGLGAYEAVVRLRADGASNSPFQVRVHFTVQPRPPARVELLTALPPQVASGAPLGVVSARLVNVLGEPTPVAGVVITASLTGGGALAGSQSIQTDANGRASFGDLVISGLVGAKTLLFGGTGLAAASAPVTLVAGPAARIVAGSALTQTALAGALAASPPIVFSEDQSGNRVGGVIVTFTPSSGGTIAPTAPITSGPDGAARLTTWQLRNPAGENTVTAASGGLAGSPITFTASGLVGPAIALAKVSGDNLAGIVSTTLGTPHVVQITDAAGNGVQGTSVTWTVTGGGSVAPTSTLTDAAGRAQAVRTLGPVPGPVTTTASTTLSSGPAAATFAVTAANSGPAQIVKVAGDAQSALAGTVLATQLAVRLLDAVGTGLVGVTVSWSTPNAGGGFPSGATSQTDPTGLAVATWQLGPTTGSQSAQAAVGGPAPAGFTATALPGPVSPTQSTIAASPNVLTAGSGTAGIVVTARDGLGNPIGGAAVVLALTGGGNLTQPAAPTNAAGVASGVFGGTTSGLKTISATIGGVPLAQAASVTVNPGPPVTVAATTATTLNVRFSQTVAPAPSVLVTDALGNPVPFAGVTYTRTSGASLLNGASTPVSVTTGAGGVATIGSWFIQSTTTTGTNVYNILRAAASGTNSVTFNGTGDVRHAADLSPVISTTCSGGGCHPANGPLTYAMLVTNAVPSTRFVASGDTLTISSTYNRLLAKMNGATAHTGGTFSASLVTLFAAWVKQGVKP